METLILRFKHDLTYDEIKCFRGAVIGIAGENNVLFHNHNYIGFRYSYPVVQYKILDGKAAIVCLDNAVPSAEKLFGGKAQEIRIGKRKVLLELQSMDIRNTVVGFADRNILYSMKNWLAFNQDNYNLFTGLDSARERLELMKSVLIGNILSMGKGLGIDFMEQIFADIISVEPAGYCIFKGIRMFAFDIEFVSNLSLPDYIGLGKGVSLGFGTIEKKHINFNI